MLLKDDRIKPAKKNAKWNDEVLESAAMKDENGNCGMRRSYEILE